uniref:Uncharacterized protein n=1 Tax=Peronospora matthiolae TaxID=2874970 RepID=A0AAV1VFZ6_9STRA
MTNHFRTSQGLGMENVSMQNLTMFGDELLLQLCRHNLE